jgi:hypothetical protein
MPENATEAASGYVDAVKWIVGLSGAVFAGVFLHPEQVAQRQGWVRILIAVVMALFGVSIVASVGYLLWINRVRRVKERLEEIETDLAKPVVVPDPHRTKKLADERDRLTKERDGAEEHMNSWFNWLLMPFFAAALTGVLAFCVSLAWPKKAVEVEKAPAVAIPLRFAITQSAVHRTQHGMQAHTFLLNQQTGEMWQMICDRQGMVTAFQRARRLDLNGNPEKDEPGKKP